MRYFLFLFILLCHPSNAQTADSAISDDLFLLTNDRGIKWTLLKKTLDNSYYIVDNSNTIIYEDLKYFHKDVVQVAFEGMKYGTNRQVLQVLDRNNAMEYIDYETLQLIPKETEVEQVRQSMCGNISYYKRVIEKKEGHFVIYEIQDNWATGNRGPFTKIIDSIPTTEVDDIVFRNKTKEESYTEFFRLPYILIYSINDKYGIWNKTDAVYDEITLVKAFTRIKRNNLYAYYEINEDPKYIELNSFEFNLARIRTVEGKAGYIDVIGNEYLDN